MHETLRLAPEPGAAREARHFVADRLRCCPEDVRDVATLLTSELVTNVIVHARTPFAVEVDFGEREIRVTVVDEAPRTPTVRVAHEARLTGRGMTLVDALATRWGVEPDPPGKRVWFLLTA